MSKKDISEINIIYNINLEYIKLFGSEFVKNNRGVCKMLIDNMEYEIMEKYNVKNYNNNKLKIKLKGIDKVTNMNDMFYGCSSLLSLPDISKLNTNNVIDMNEMFYGCALLLSLPDISKWNTNNVTNMSHMFFDCSSLSSLPDISKWNTNNVTDMSYMFNRCLNIIISKIIKIKFNL